MVVPPWPFVASGRHVPSLELLTDTVFAAARGYLEEILGFTPGIKKKRHGSFFAVVLSILLPVML